MEVEGGNVVTRFQDDGVGIRRDILPKIFDPFFTTKRPGRGTGLGLSICLAILREHGGQIEAQTLAEGGSLFTVVVPVAQGNALFLSDSPSAVQAALPPTPADALAGASVLVVDDEESIRELVRDGLGARGMRVDAAATAEEALGLLDGNRYDAILCDVNLRGGGGDILSGRELYARIYGRGSASSNAEKPFFLFMTGEFVDRGTVEGLEGRGVRTLQKPFRISDLVALLSDSYVGTAAGGAGVKTIN